jgi:hypothetical protein
MYDVFKRRTLIRRKERWERNVDVSEGLMIDSRVDSRVAG